MKHALLAALSIFMGCAGLTWCALEASDVAVLETQRPDGATRTTRVWHVSHEGEIWLEAGTPESPWLHDVEAAPRVSLTIDGRSTEYLSEVVRDPSGHDTIRSLLRKQYGLRDWWVGLLFDTSRSVAVRLLPPT